MRRDQREAAAGVRREWGGCVRVVVGFGGGYGAWIGRNPQSSLGKPVRQIPLWGSPGLTPTPTLACYSPQEQPLIHSPTHRSGSLRGEERQCGPCPQGWGQGRG